MLQESVGEAQGILQEEQRVLSWVEHLEGEEADSNDIVTEDKGAQDVGVLAILLR